MKATGIIRRIDDLGRIVIPKELRRQIFGTQDASGEPMEFFMDGNDIVLRKYVDAEKIKEQGIRNLAIDEFAERIKEHTKIVGSTTCEDLDEIAKQMKRGK